MSVHDIGCSLLLCMSLYAYRSGCWVDKKGHIPLTAWQAWVLLVFTYFLASCSLSGEMLMAVTWAPIACMQQPKPHVCVVASMPLLPHHSLHRVDPAMHCSHHFCKW
jgi:hypothetical protein